MSSEPLKTDSHQIGMDTVNLCKTATLKKTNYLLMQVEILQYFNLH